MTTKTYQVGKYSIRIDDFNQKVGLMMGTLNGPVWDEEKKEFVSDTLVILNFTELKGLYKVLQKYYE